MPTVGSEARSTPKRAHRSSSQSPRRRSNNSVRDAFDGSVAHVAPAVRFHSSQASTVPKTTSSPVIPPASRSQAIFVAEK